MGTPAVEKGLRPVETGNHTDFFFTEALKRIRPETEGTPVPELVSGLICSFGEIVYQRDNGERAVLITESGAQILYNPQEKARQLPAQIKRIQSCCQGREAQETDGIKDILDGLAEGPDLDLKMTLKKEVGFESLEAIMEDHLRGLAGISLEGENFYRFTDGMNLEVRKLFIPIYDFDPEMEKEFSRPLLEFRFRKRDGSLILKVHLTTSPLNSALNYAADCRLGWSSSLKNTVCRAKVILPDNPEIKHQRLVVRLEKLVADFLRGGDNLSASRFIKVDNNYYDILNILPRIPIRATIGVLRLIETAFLTMSDSQITQGQYWEELFGGISLDDISAVFDKITRDERLHSRPIPPSAKQEILNLWLRTLLINDPKLVLETAFDLGMLDLFKAIREDFQDIVALTGRLKNPQPERIVADLNSFEELFSL